MTLRKILKSPNYPRGEVEEAKIKLQWNYYKSSSAPIIMACNLYPHFRKQNNQLWWSIAFSCSIKSIKRHVTNSLNYSISSTISAKIQLISFYVPWSRFRRVNLANLSASYSSSLSLWLFCSRPLLPLASSLATTEASATGHWRLISISPEAPPSEVWVQLNTVDQRLCATRDRTEVLVITILTVDAPPFNE